MPSFKKVQKARQVPHRERKQPKERRDLGILEKKKDYKIRAINARKKETTIKNLKKQALSRNPDEFFYNMITQSRERSQDFDDEDSDDDDQQIGLLDHEKLLITQDTNYVNWKLQIQKKKVEKLEEQIKLIKFAKTPKNQHFFFVDKDEDIPVNANRVKHSACNPKTNESELKKLKSELQRRRARLRELQIISDKLSLEKELSNDKFQHKELVTNESKNRAAIYKWKPMRKK